MAEPRASQDDRSRRGSTTRLALLAASIGGVVVFVLLLWPSRPPSTGGLEPDRLADLEHRLEVERSMRDVLDARVGELESELAGLRQMLGELARRGDPADADGALAERDVRSDGVDPGEGEVQGFDAEPLLEAGVDPREVERLQAIWEEDQRERAELLNRSLREGYFLDDRHKAELAEIDAALRGRLEGQDYDLYLYATGQPNRVKASRVLSNTNASEAGLRKDDVIVRYGDEAVYKPGDLVVAASKGELGDSVALEVERDGRRLTLYARRGPLGVLLEPTRRLPESGR